MGASDRYRRLLERLDRWMDEVRERHPGVIPCRTGCSACCHGPFDITVADLELLREGVARLPAGERADVGRRAEALLARMVALEPGWSPPFDVATLGDDRFDRMADALTAEPCPVLGQDGGCRMYPDRPMVCRMIGLPLLSPAGRLIENACPIMDRFPGYAALPPQPFDLEGFEELELECLEGAARRLFGDPSHREFETTIAAALAPSSPTAA